MYKQVHVLVQMGTLRIGKSPSDNNYHRIMKSL